MSTTTVEADRRAIGDKHREAERSALGIQVEIGRMIESLLDKAGERARADAKEGTKDKAFLDARAEQRKLLSEEEGIDKGQITFCRKFVVLCDACEAFATLTLGAAQRLAKLAVGDRATDTYSVPQTDEQPWREMLATAISEIADSRNQVKAAQERVDLITDDSPNHPEPVAEDTPPAKPVADEDNTCPTCEGKGCADCEEEEDEGEEEEEDTGPDVEASLENLLALPAAQAAAHILRASADKPQKAYHALGGISDVDQVKQFLRGFVTDWLLRGQDDKPVDNAVILWHLIGQEFTTCNDIMVDAGVLPQEYSSANLKRNKRKAVAVA